MSSAAEWIAAYISAQGTEFAFGVSGANIEPLFYQCRKSGLVTPVLARHEAAAVNMAEGYFRKSGKLGVVLTTSGAGAFNILGALAECLETRIPLLAIVGQIPSSQEGVGGFQNSSGKNTRIDSEAIFTPLTVLCRKARTVEDLPRYIEELTLSAWNSRGPAVLLLPRQLLEETLDVPLPISACVPKKEITADVQCAIKALLRSRRSLFIAGSEILLEGYLQSFKELVRRTGGLVALTPDAKGVWDHYDTSFVGLTGAMGHPSLEYYMKDADLCIIVGTGLPLMSRTPGLNWFYGAHICHWRRGPRLFAAAASIDDFEGSVGDLIEDVLLQFEAKPSLWNISAQKPLRDLKPAAVEPLECTMLFADAMEIINMHIPANADIFIDAGNCGAAAIHYLMPRGRGLCVVALSMGGMGHSFGSSIGAACAGSAKVFVLAGDGSFFMHGWELHTAWQHHLPITFIIFDNSGYGMCHIRERVFLGEATGDQLFPHSDIAKGMTALLPGLSAWNVHDAGDLNAALKSACAVNGPCLIVIASHPEETPPLYSFIHA
jgi:acetolactate synthase I/II/III large subunit